MHPYPRLYFLTPDTKGHRMKLPSCGSSEVVQGRAATSSDTPSAIKEIFNGPTSSLLPDAQELLGELHEELQEAVPDVKPYHFVFSYGSLICKKSRIITAPTLADKDAIPVQIQGVERIWAKRTQRGMTAMGVRFKKGSVCTGVLLPVTEEELVRFDGRENGYDRYQIPLDNVEEVPFLAKKKHYEKMDYEHADVVFPESNVLAENEEVKEKTTTAVTTTKGTASSKNTITTVTTTTTTTTTITTSVGDNNGAEHKVFIWIYIQRYDIPADEEFPIAQSYVDIILRGCMGISKEFCSIFYRDH